MDDSATLLRNYRQRRSEESFRLLVERSSGLVQSTALRRLAGDRSAAQDVTQEVFALLARKAGKLPADVTLAGWLYRQCCRLTANYVRAESRRRNREMLSARTMKEETDRNPLHARQVAGEIDEALLALRSPDRDVLVLRFFEERNHRAVGKALGITEEAARKRVARALEKLRTVLTRRGVTVSSTGLATVLASLTPSPAPAAVVSEISVEAFSSAGSSLGAGAGSTVMAFVAGVLLTSAVAGSLLIAGSDRSVQRQGPGSAATGIDASRPDTRPRQAPVYLRPLPKDRSLESLMAEIKLLLDAPDNSLRRERLIALLDLVPIEDIPRFISLGNSEMTAGERAPCYDLLLYRWLKDDPVAVLVFAGTERVGDQVDKAGGTNLLLSLFRSFMDQDREGCREWLLAHWQETYLDDEAWVRSGSLRRVFARQLTAELLHHDGLESAFAFVNTLPTEEDRLAALERIAGIETDFEGWSDGRAETRFALARRLQDHPDPDARRRLTQSLWARWAHDDPHTVATVVQALEAKERFDVALGLINTFPQRGKAIPRITGELLEHRGGEAFRETLRDDALATGLEAGLDRSEVVNRIGTAIARERRVPDSLEWIRTHRDELQIDAELAQRVRHEAGASGWSGKRLPGVVAIEWASEIRDEELRRQLQRACYRRMFRRDHEFAEAYLDDAALPAELVAELRPILDETP